MQALAILFGALLTVAVSVALGGLLLGQHASDLGIRFVSGAALLSLFVFCLCSAGLAYPWLFGAIGVMACVVGLLIRVTTRVVNFINPILLPIFGAYFLLYFFNSMAPEFSFDGSRYHLGLVSRYLREHGFHRITDNLYASLSQGVEMLYLYAFAFGKHSAAAMVHFAFLLALAWMMFSYARRWGFPLPGACASLLVFASPLVGVDGTSAYNDVAVAAIAFTLFYVLQIWDEGRSRRLLVAIGLLAGFGYAAKYTAWLAVPYALGFVAWRSRRLRDVSIVGLAAAVMLLPWLVKNWMWFQNPFAPFLNQWFPNPYLTNTFENDYRHGLVLYSLTSRWQIPLQVTTFGSLSGLLGPVFLLSPLALAAVRRREGRQLMLAAAVFGANYFSNISARFLIAPLPFVALSMMLVLSFVPRVALGIVLVHALISWPTVVRRYCHPDAWHLVKIPWREALRIKPEDGWFLQSNLPLYGVTRMVEATATPGSTVFTFTPIPEAYTSRKIRVSYQSVQNTVSRAVLYTGFVPEYAPTWRLRFSFPRRPLRAIRVVQTNTGGDLWNIHELRIFDGADELPRDPGWNWTAKPYPWGIENVADNRLITFWVSGDTLHPGQFVEADFGRDLAADSVLLETAPNQYGIRLELDGQDASGVWKRLASEPQMSDRPAPPDLRLAAARELKRRGIDYLLMFDQEFGAGDLRSNQGLWGIRQVGEYKGARLYQLP